MNTQSKDTEDTTIIELTAFLFQIARNHQHFSVESLLRDAKAILPEVMEEQWDLAAVELAHILHKNDYMGFATQFRLQGKPRKKKVPTEDMDDGPA
jgi:hypothetical protein